MGCEIGIAKGVIGWGAINGFIGVWVGANKGLNGVIGWVGGGVNKGLIGVI